MLDFTIKPAIGFSTQGPKASREPKFTPLCADEVENRQTLLIVMETQSTSELLQVDSQALCRAKE